MARQRWHTATIRGRKVEVEYELDGEFEEDTNAGPVAFIASSHDAETGEDVKLTDDERDRVEVEIVATHHDDRGEDGDD